MSSVESKPVHVIARKWFWLSIGSNILLLVLAGGLALFAFMLSYDLQDARLRLNKETEARQRAEQFLSESRAKAAEVEREIQRLSQALSEKIIDPAQMSSDKTPMPVAVRFRRSYLGIGLVAVIENKSGKQLSLLMTVRNPTLAVAKRFQIDIGPEGDLAFGHDDGWKFSSGDEFGLYHNDFRPIRLQVP